MSEQEIKTIIEKLKKELLPIGSIICYAAPICPEGYLPCDGRELLQSQYTDLYKVIGNTFGGSPKTFCLPDLRGLFIRGWDDEGDSDPEREFGNKQSDTIQGHSHSFDTKQISIECAGSHSHTVKASITKAGTWGSEIEVLRFLYNKGKDSCLSDDNGMHTHTIKVNGGNPVSIPENSLFGIVKVSTETRPKNLALLYCIKVK